MWETSTCNILLGSRWGIWAASLLKCPEQQQYFVNKLLSSDFTFSVASRCIYWIIIRSFISFLKFIWFVYFMCFNLFFQQSAFAVEARKVSSFSCCEQIWKPNLWPELFSFHQRKFAYCYYSQFYIFLHTSSQLWTGGFFFPRNSCFAGHSLALSWGAGALYWAMVNVKKKMRVSAIHCRRDHHPLELALSFYIFIKFEELRSRGLHLWLPQDHCQWSRANNSQYIV